jgi:hypothetical protein
MMNSQILNKNATLVFEPKITPWRVIDDEGSFRERKYIIKNGILVNCCNNIKSAIMLGQTSGNSIYSIYSDENSIDCSNLSMSFGKNIRLPKDCKIVTEIDETNLQFNLERAEFELIFSAKAHGEEERWYYLKRNIIDIIRDVYGEYGERNVIANNEVPNVVFRFQSGDAEK